MENGIRHDGNDTSEELGNRLEMGLDILYNLVTHAWMGYLTRLTI